MTSQPPVWLLDVDGVINANRPGWGSAPHRRFAYLPTPRGLREYKLTWAPALIRRILQAKRAGVDVRWCTTWCEVPDELTRVLRIELPSALTPEQAADTEVNYFKLAAATAVVLEERRPLIWTDDMALPKTPAEWAPFLNSMVPWLMLEPRENRGLQEEHLDYIQGWVDRLP